MLLLFFSSFVLAFTASTIHQGTASPSDASLRSRIVGGESAAIQILPYQVLVYLVQANRFCGGSIIAPRWVLTAAHCLVSEIITIRAGTSTLNEGGSVHKVVKLIPHPAYHRSTTGVPINDIALLKVKEPFQFDETRQWIKLWEEQDPIEVGSLGTVSGWGRLTDKGKISKVLKSVMLPIIDDELCASKYSKLMKKLPSGQICTQDPEGSKDACQSDSGGPLVIDQKLVGIISWAEGCAGEYPGVYTEVSKYRKWIGETIRQYRKKSILKLD